MGVAVIGGLITSTLLSLLVIPAVFTFVDDFKEGLAGGWLRKLKAKLARKSTGVVQQ
jgi:predicted RND superfamily exporter protein